MRFAHECVCLCACSMRCHRDCRHHIIRPFLRVENHALHILTECTGNDLAACNEQRNEHKCAAQQVTHFETHPTSDSYTHCARTRRQHLNHTAPHRVSTCRSKIQEIFFLAVAHRLRFVCPIGLAKIPQHMTDHVDTPSHSQCTAPLV